MFYKHFCDSGLPFRGPGYQNIKKTPGFISIFTISYNNSHRHFVDFELSTKTLGKDKMQFQLATWRPGRYELANFSQNIQKWGAFDDWWIKR